MAAHQGSAAAAEFEKILDHRGIVLNEPIGALAHLQIGRAYAMQGDTAKAKAVYQDFLTLWKDADPDIPILKQAKARAAPYCASRPVERCIAKAALRRTSTELPNKASLKPDIAE